MLFVAVAATVVVVVSFRNCCYFIHLTHIDLLITQKMKNKMLQFGSKVIFTTIISNNKQA